MAWSKQAKQTVSHAMALIVGVVLTILSGQNPRVLLYALAISALYRLISVWLLATRCESQSSPEPLIRRLSREPAAGERSRPWRDQGQGGFAGISTYTVVILTVIFMLTVVFEMAGGQAFLAVGPELVWAAVIAVAYWGDDLFSKQIVLSPGQSIAKNLGFNVSGLNFLLAAVFISALVILVILNIAALVISDWPEYLPVVLTWLVFLVLSLLRFIADVLELRRINGTLP